MDWKASIRKRPGMYVGDLGAMGVMHMLLEVLGNSFDQYLLGRCRRIDLRVEGDGWVTVEDDGPGVSAGRWTSLTNPHDTPTADGHRPHVHLSFGGGLAVVNALSERLDVVTVHDGIETVASFARGEVVEAATSLPTTRASGTRVRFRADPEIFSDVRPPRLALARRLEELTVLSPGLALSWSLAGDATDTRGLAALVALDARCDERSVAHHRGTYGTEPAPIQVEVALSLGCGSRYHDAEVRSFANFARTPEGGEHVEGLLDGLSAAFGLPLAALTEGLVAAVAVVLADVTFGSPTRGRLDSTAARPAVAKATLVALTAWREGFPDQAEEILERARDQEEIEARAARRADPSTDDVAILVLEGHQAVRRSPGLFLGSGGGDLRMRLLERALALPIAHHHAGGCSHLHVDVSADDVVTITDDGVEVERSLQRRQSHFVATDWGLWRYLQDYLVDGGHHLPTVCGLSETFEITVVNGRRRAHRSWCRGLDDGEVEYEDSDDAEGTTLRFRLDPEIFGTREVPRPELAALLDELAANHPGLRVTRSIA